MKRKVLWLSLVIFLLSSCSLISNTGDLLDSGDELNQSQSYTDTYEETHNGDVEEEKEVETDTSNNDSKDLLNQEQDTQKVEKQEAKSQDKITYKESKETLSIPYETIYQEDNSLEHGKTKVVQKGVNGSKEIVYTYKYNHEQLIDTKQEVRIIQQPINEIIKKGIKKEVSQNTNPTSNQEINQLFNLVNNARSQNGLPPYRWAGFLDEASRIRAQEITQKFDHTRPNGQAWYTVHGQVDGENLAYGQTSAQQVFNEWMASPSHRANILHNDHRSMSIALTKDGQGVFHWVQLFSWD